MVTRSLCLLVLLALSASAQTPRIPPPESVNRNGLVRRWFVAGMQAGDGSLPASFLGPASAATNVNGVVWTTFLGRSMAWFSATGQNSFASAPSLGFLAPPATFVGFICITNNQQQYDGIIGARVNATGGNWLFHFATGNKITFTFSNLPAEYDFAGGPVVPLNRVVLVAAVLHTNLTRLVLIESGGIGATNIVKTNTPRALNGRVDIGYDTASGRVSNMQGLLSDWRVYSIALRDADLINIYRGLQ
jgi:hypothetical protein